MLIHNLTDCTPPNKPARVARKLKIAGVVIEAGKSAEVPDSVRTASFAGFITSNEVSIGMQPDWYRKAKAEVSKPKPLPTREHDDREAEEREPVDVEKPETAKAQPKKAKKRKKS